MTFVGRQDKAFVVTLDSTSMQQWLGVYELPEEEPKRFVWTRRELKAAIKAAIKSAEGIQADVHKVQMWERYGYTYAEVHKFKTGEEASGGITEPSDRKYQADEELMFLFWALSEIWSFVFLAREELADASND